MWEIYIYILYIFINMYIFFLLRKKAQKKLMQAFFFHIKLFNRQSTISNLINCSIPFFYLHFLLEYIKNV